MVTETYKHRNERLKEMGFDSYKQYLESKLWKSIKLRAWLQLGRTCVLCRGEADVLHHVGYGMEVLRGTNLDALKPLCNKCHKIVEFRANSRKRTLASAHARFIKLLKGFIAGERISHKKSKVRCKGCGEKPKKGSCYCRPCIKRMRRLADVDFSNKLVEQLFKRTIR